jgi:hypothetical protein
MVEFERLQELWQRQEASAVPSADAENLTRSLRAYARRQYTVNIVKAILLAAVLGWMIGRLQPSLRVIAGWGLIAIASAVLLAREWRSQRALSRLEFHKPSLGFVESTIGRLQEQRDPRRRIYWPFMASMVVSMNLMLAGTHRLWVRVVASGLPFLAFELGMWIRRKRFELECRPLLDQLASMRSALEERVD